MYDLGASSFVRCRSSLDSAAPQPWQTVMLDNTNMGEWEPTMDYSLWNSQNMLDLFYQPSGFSTLTQNTAQVLQWDEAAYFASLPEPTGAMALLAAGSLLLGRRIRRSSFKSI